MKTHRLFALIFALLLITLFMGGASANFDPDPEPWRLSGLDFTGQITDDLVYLDLAHVQKLTLGDGCSVSARALGTVENPDGTVALAIAIEGDRPLSGDCQ